MPVKLSIRPDLGMTNNPQFCQAGADDLDCWFAPADDHTRIYHYRAALPRTN